MQPRTTEIEQILAERFGHDTLIALATVSGSTPYVRAVNALYMDGAFYVLTHALSGKMRQLAENPVCALSGEWFTAHGTGVSLGSFSAPENVGLAQTLRAAFSGWIDNGHVDLSDPHSIILKIRLTQGVLFSHGRRFDVDFTR